MLHVYYFLTKAFTLCFLVIIYTVTSHAQVWVNINGIKSNMGLEVSGTQKNKYGLPASRSSPLIVYADTNIFLIGGFGINKLGKKSALNDIWKYSPKRNEWYLYYENQMFAPAKWLRKTSAIATN
jgi:hypothetical protein